MVENYSVLKKTLFSNLTKWNVSELISNNIIGNYKNQPLGNYLVRSKNAIEIKDDELYKQITIHQFGGGVSLRCEKYGRDIKTKRQFVAKKGQFIISRIDARNGSFGIVSDFLDGAVVTNDFWLFDIKNAEPQFFVLFLSSQKINSFWQSKSNGTTNRQRVDFKDFIESALPIPPLEEQRKIIRKYQETVSQAENLEVQAEKKEKETQIYLEKSLNLHVRNTQKDANLHFVSFKNLTRWDWQFYSEKTQVSSKYELKNVEDCIDFFMKKEDGSSLRIESSKLPESEFMYIGMENISKNSGELNEKKIILGKEIKSQTVTVPNDYFIYGKLRPYLNKYWQNIDKLENVICSSEFFVFKIKNNINKNYFKYLISSNFIQKQIDNKTSGARMPRLNEADFMQLKLPLPPLSVQEEIVNHITQIKSQVKELRSKAAKLRQSAKTDFERSVFE